MIVFLSNLNMGGGGEPVTTIEKTLSLTRSREPRLSLARSVEETTSITRDVKLTLGSV